MKPDPLKPIKFFIEFWKDNWRETILMMLCPLVLIFYPIVMPITAYLCWKKEYHGSKH